jgi:hypothetical protein
MIEFGKGLVSERLTRLGCSVARPSNARDGRRVVRTPGERQLEVFVSTQRVGGYVEIGRSALASLRRFAWSDSTARTHFS